MFVAMAAQGEGGIEGLAAQQVFEQYIDSATISNPSQKKSSLTQRSSTVKPLHQLLSRFPTASPTAYPSTGLSSGKE